MSLTIETRTGRLLNPPTTHGIESSAPQPPNRPSSRATLTRASVIQQGPRPSEPTPLATPSTSTLALPEYVDPVDRLDDMSQSITIRDKLKSAQIRIMDEDYINGAAQIRSLIAEGPESSEMLVWLGTADRLRGDFGEAIRYLRKAVTEDPSNWFGRANLAAAYLSVGDSARSEQETAAALAVNPTSVLALLCKAGCLAYHGKFAQAETVFQNILDYFPANDAAWAGIAIYNSYEGKKSECLKAAYRALSENPHNGAALYILQENAPWTKGSIRANMWLKSLNLTLCPYVMMDLTRLPIRTTESVISWQF